MLIALLPLLQALAAGTPIGAAVASISISQWISIGAAAIDAAPAEVQAAQSIHDVLDNVIGKVVEAGVATVASQAAKDWLAANGDAAIARDPGISLER
jgi:hypothetical protein